MDLDKLNTVCQQVRQDILLMIENGQRGHIGGSLSVVEILVLIYHHLMGEKDRLVYSKGHAVEALYAVLASKGILNREEVLKNYGINGTKYGCHPNHEVPGVTMHTGSLGHGLGIAAGMALGNLIKATQYGLDFKEIFCVVGDAECMEGSIWEAAMFAGNHRLRNLTLFVDRNNEMTLDKVNEEMFEEKFKSFGWHVQSVEGHSLSLIDQAVFHNNIFSDSKPSCIICYTVKGRGISFMEKGGWHHKVPNKEQFAQAKKELGL